jgi:hypothetical protein
MVTPASHHEQYPVIPNFRNCTEIDSDQEVTAPTLTPRKEARTLTPDPVQKVVLLTLPRAKDQCTGPDPAPALRSQQRVLFYFRKGSSTKTFAR